MYKSVKCLLNRAPTDPLSDGKSGDRITEKSPKLSEYIWIQTIVYWSFKVSVEFKRWSSFQHCRNKLPSFEPSAPSIGTRAPGGTPQPVTSSGGWPPWHAGRQTCPTRPSVPLSATLTLTSSTLEPGIRTMTAYKANWKASVIFGFKLQRWKICCSWNSYKCFKCSATKISYFKN